MPLPAIGHGIERHNREGVSPQYGSAQSPSLDAYVISRYLSLIENRLKVVENRLNSLESGRIRPITPDDSATGSSNVAVLNDPSDSTHLETASLRDDNFENGDTAEDSIDGMGTVTFAQEEDCAFFGISAVYCKWTGMGLIMPIGPSSNIAFLRHLSRAVSRLRHASRPWRPSTAEPSQARFISGFFNVSRPSTPPAPRHITHPWKKLTSMLSPPTISLVKC